MSAPGHWSEEKWGSTSRDCPFNTPAEIPTSLDRVVPGVKNGNASGRLVNKVNAGENELELNYDEGRDVWEEGEVHEDAEVRLPMVQGTKSSSAMDSSVGVLQKSSVDHGDTAGKQRSLAVKSKNEMKSQRVTFRVIEGAGEQKKALEGEKGQTQEPKDSKVMEGTRVPADTTKVMEEAGDENKDKGGHRKWLPYMGLAMPLGSHADTTKLCMIWMFFGDFKLSELLGSGREPGVLHGEIRLEQGQLGIWLWKSKMDQTGKGKWIWLQEGGREDACPVEIYNVSKAKLDQQWLLVL
ncbi:hypothetical protein NDU88_003744 [Pleurodeles waltl]|uniref:Uncharacterized protein n=1 Tax=Pleurodeles waltl TaxID=8319 RepID=A0AAV7VF24_PLEWA|nr:hypothetical protein NDU88_003744 [Pleurodeles waltl]